MFLTSQNQETNLLLLTSISFWMSQFNLVVMRNAASRNIKDNSTGSFHSK